MRIAVTGATGFVGRHLVARLREKGHEVRALVRDLGRAEDALGAAAELRVYDPYDAADVRDALTDVDGVVNLAGENIFGARWTTAVKQSLRDSRVVTTRVLYDALHPVKLEERPKVFVSASAVGYYGARPAGTACPEDEHAATQLNAPDFLGHLCEEWEAAARRLELLGLRVVTPRIGVVLGRGGGALQQMEPVARKHVSVQMGNGRQVVSWVHLDDLVNILVYALETPDLKGPVNATAPEPVTSRQLAKSLAKAMGKRAILPGMPAPVAKLVFGKGRASMLLEGQEVKPYVLQDRGFRFRFPDIDSALGDLYAK